MIMDDRLKLITQINNIDYYEYRPTFGKWLYRNYEKMPPQRWIRFFLEYIATGKYVIYYMAKDNDILGYCFTAPGGRRLGCSYKDDIVLGPYYILPKHRNSGFSKELINAIIDNLHTDYNYAYDYINKGNIPSIRATEACGFERYSELNISRYFRRLKIVNNGEYIVFRKRSSTRKIEDL